MPAPLPHPPAHPPTDLPATIRVRPSLLWRLHDEPKLLDPKSYPTGKWRFDAPRGEYPVTYGNLDYTACFAEVYGDGGLIPDSAGKRRLSMLWPMEPLQVIPLEDGPTLSKLGIDSRITNTDDYALTQEWGRALHDWYPDADGISYLGRKATMQLNYCLFLDRCRKGLSTKLLGRIEDHEAMVESAADTWGLAFGGFASGPAGFP